MEFQAILAEFGQATGLGDLALDAEGTLSLLFDDTIELHFVHDKKDNAVMLYSVLGSCVHLKNIESWQSLLRVSLLGAETGGASFGLHGDSIILWKRYDSFAYSIDLEQAVNTMLAQTEHWSARLALFEEAPINPSGEGFVMAGLKV